MDNSIYINPEEASTESSIDWSCDLSLKNKSVFEEVNFKFIRAVVGEFFATTGFLWVTISTATFMFGSPDFLLSVAFAFGISIAVLVAGFADVSGGHINQNVTFGLFLRGQISLIRCVCYTVAQMMGAVVGSALVKATDPTAYDRIDGGANKVKIDSNGLAIMAEMIGTTILVYTVFTVCDTNKSKNFVGWLAIGLSVFLGHLALLNVTNTSINYSRTFGAAVVSGYWTDNWVFFVATYLGSIFAACLYEFFKARKGVDY
jgi:MIP family channel proteins